MRQSSGRAKGAGNHNQVILQGGFGSQPSILFKPQPKTITTFATGMGKLSGNPSYTGGGRVNSPVGVTFVSQKQTKNTSLTRGTHANDQKVLASIKVVPGPVNEY